MFEDSVLQERYKHKNPPPPNFWKKIVFLLSGKLLVLPPIAATASLATTPRMTMRLHRGNATTPFLPSSRPAAEVVWRKLTNPPNQSIVYTLYNKLKLKLCIKIYIYK